MGQKVSPIGLRIGINKDWESKWYANKSNTSKFLNNDVKIRKYLEDTFDDSLVDIYCEYIKKCKDRDDIIKYLEDRLLDIKANNYPFEAAPSRDDMPQVFKGGTDAADKSSALPDKEGSAMNKLKNDKFMKSITK